MSDEKRCEMCGWPLRETLDEGCVAGNCSMRPLPKRRRVDAANLISAPDDLAQLRSDLARVTQERDEARKERDEADRDAQDIAMAAFGNGARIVHLEIANGDLARERDALSGQLTTAVRDARATAAGDIQRAEAERDAVQADLAAMNTERVAWQERANEMRHRAERAEGERDAYRATVCDLLAAAHPHPTEHPTMAREWDRAREVLKTGVYTQKGPKR
jgi:chromosome segregation ATPase